MFPSGRSGIAKIKVGDWRSESAGPMRVVSGPVGRELVHFEAPAAGLVAREMQSFLDWSNAPAEFDPVLKAALAHLWFLTIHPFEDGNGRIARVIADMALARSENSPHGFYSMSAQIRQERKPWYDILEQTQKSTLDITPWLEWFVGCLGVTLNESQRLVLNRLLDGFEGELTTSKYARLARCSPETALRHIMPLVKRGVLVRNVEGGRSTSYAIPDPAAWD